MLRMMAAVGRRAHLPTIPQLAATAFAPTSGGSSSFFRPFRSLASPFSSPAASPLEAASASSAGSSSACSSEQNLNVDQSASTPAAVLPNGAAPIYDDPVFGPMRHTTHGSLPWYETHVSFGSQQYRMVLDYENDRTNLLSAAATAHRFYKEPVWMELARAELRGLYDSYQKNWLDDDDGAEDDEEPVARTEAEFVARIEADLSSVHCSAKGRWSVVFGDADLLGGHIISIEGTFEKGVKYVNIDG